MDIQADFLNDICKQFTAYLSAMGYEELESDDDSACYVKRVLRAYWNISNRRVPARPREVHWSTELKGRFACLTPGQQNALLDIEDELKFGKDVQPRLSRKISTRDFHDKMLNDWGIQHLHLGREFESSGMIKGTKEILFLKIRDNNAYFIDVMDHRWADKTVIEIVHNNWPEVLAPFRANISASNLSESQRKNLRRKNVNASVSTSDGAVYIHIGGGSVASGLNINAVRWTDKVMEEIRGLESSAKANANQIAFEVERLTGGRPSTLRLRAEWHPKFFRVYVCDQPGPLVCDVPVVRERITPWTVGTGGEKLGD